MATDTNVLAIKQNEQKKFSFCQSLLTDPDTCKLLIFFLITLGFAFIEFFSGYMANSLSLMSDSVHMLFDSSALAIAVYAQVKAKSPPDILHSFGFERYKVLAGYINGIFLLFIAFFIFIEAIDRMVNPPKIMSNLILIVAIIGFIINIVGLIFFHGYSGITHNHSHSHSAQKEQNSNLAAVFLHILADALGSVGVIISAILIQHWKLYRSDPITSAIISLLIIASLIPLMKTSGKIMLQSYESKHSKKLKQLLQILSNDSDIIEFSNLHLWPYIQNQLIFTISVICKKGIDEIVLLKRIQELVGKIHAIKEATIQIEEEKPKEENIELQLGPQALTFDTIEADNSI